MRLSSRLERGLVERMVQNASESARIRPDPAQVAKLRRILDRPRAVPPGWGETQTDFGPPHPQDASPSCGSGAPTPVVRWRSRRTVRWRFPRPRPIASGQATTYMSRQPPGSSRASPGRNHPLGQATTYWGRKIAYPNAQLPTPMPGPGAGGARSPVWRSEMRLSSRLERGLVERMVQNASESARIRPDPAQVAKLRRILDRPRAVPPGWGETQTDFGPPHPAQEASPSCGSGAPTPWFGGAPGARFSGAFRARNRSHRAGNHLLSRQPPGSSRASPGHNHRVRGTLYPESPGSSRASPGRNHPLGQATTYWGRKIAYPNAQFPTPMPGAGARQSPPHSSARLVAPTGEHPGRSHWLSARTGPPPPPPCRLGLGALDERTVE